MLDETRIAEFLVRWEVAKDAGEILSLDDSFPNEPEYQKEVGRRIHLLRIADSLLHLEEPPETSRKYAEIAPTDYEIRGRLGTGGMGVVYLARHKLLQRDVALKVLRPGQGASPQRMRRFVREAQALARLRHENIVPIYDARFHDGEFYFAMELVRGGTLATRIDQFRQPKRAAAIVEQVARALQHAHDHGILHRDLKPGNVLLDQSGKPLVADFGLARFLNINGPDSSPNSSNSEPTPTDLSSDTLSVPSTWAGAQPGTPPYMAPEQFDVSFGEQTARSDVWALGVISYELLTGRRPFDGPSVAAIARAVCEGSLVRPRQWRKDIDPGLEAIIQKCLEKKTSDRYASAADVADELRRWQAAEPVLAYPEGPLRNSIRRLWRQRSTALKTVIMSGIAALIAVLILRGFVPAPVDQKETPTEPKYLKATRPLLDQLESGKRIELLSANKEAVPYQRIFGDVRVQQENDEGKRSLVVVGRGLGLVELLPAPACKSYRLSLRMRQLDTFSAKSDFGIYVAQDTATDENGRQLYFVRLAFADLGETASMYKSRQGQSGSEVQLGQCFIGEDPSSIYRTAFSQAPNLFYIPEHAMEKPAEWREFTVDVRPDSIQVKWGSKTVGPFKMARREDWFKSFRRRQPSVGIPETITSFRGALGVYVNSASAAIEQYSIEPLSD